MKGTVLDFWNSLPRTKQSCTVEVKSFSRSLNNSNLNFLQVVHTFAENFDGKFSVSKNGLKLDRNYKQF